MSDTMWQAATLIVPLVLAIVFHEVAHGWVAGLLGDPTAREQRRLSLNPLRHVDPMGTVILPGFLALIKAPVFGWAKPVPVDARRLRDPRRDMMIVAAAGPGTNLVLALLGAIGLGLLARFTTDATQPGTALLFLAANLQNFIALNIFLAVFNLLPVPPFDGSHIVEGLLPERAAMAYARVRPYGLPIMLLLLFVLPQIAPNLHIVDRLILPPVQWLGSWYEMVAQAVAGPEMN
ncbi:site-2 protease family protein [Novosphingobium sp. EMRT-2]|uniref:site-2 protease family protein n=1 Tax=Novosphingobium sp. EMRT-2 TaxID=2571749 RepID=UPI0010BD16AB|nr:site-2 protease family protein [Novosphingobium sp. EMRT-2]QCI94996.1 site-2 protease family protein [Novosphingobium sp. EMRT-2]